MYRNSVPQDGLLSIMYSIGSQPLGEFEVRVRNGTVERVTDQEIKSSVVEIKSSNVNTTYISCPKKGRSLGIGLEYFVMIVKNIERLFTFEIEIVDDTNARRRFRASNYQTRTKVRDFICTMPLRLERGWNEICINLQEFTRRAYGTKFVEVSRVTVNANCRLRRIFFANRPLEQDQLPDEFRLHLPPQTNSSLGPS